MIGVRNETGGNIGLREGLGGYGEAETESGKPQWRKSKMIEPSDWGKNDKGEILVCGKGLRGYGQGETGNRRVVKKCSRFFWRT